MIRDARTFFKAMLLGFLLPAGVLGAGLLWLNDQSPASTPIAETDAAETASFQPSSARSPSVGTASHQPPTEPAPPAVAIAVGLGENARTQLNVMARQSG